jgi:hypothetical protein
MNESRSKEPYPRFGEFKIYGCTSLIRSISSGLFVVRCLRE